MNGLAAAIAEIKEWYERESAGRTEPIDALEGDEALLRQRADNPELDLDAERAEVNEAKARTARAVAALASEHEERLAAEVELARLCAGIEEERERTREAIEQAKAADERCQRAEAAVIQLRHEIEARHHQAEEEYARLTEEADDLGQRLQAAERDLAQFQEVESARPSLRRWARRSTATALVLSGIAVAVLSAWLLFPEPAKDGIISAVAAIQTSWVVAKEEVFGKPQPTTTPVPQPPVPSLGAGQPRALAATPIDSGPEQIKISSRERPNSPGQQDSGQKDGGDSSQSRPQTSGNQQQPSVAPPAQDKMPEPKLAPPASVSADALSDARHGQPQVSDKEQADTAQENAQAKLAPQSEPTPTPSPQPSRLSTTSASPPTNDASLTTAVAVHVSIHYQQGSPSGRADAERVATWLASSGFSASQLLGRQHAPKEQVVRYFFAEDAEVANRIVGELRKRGGRWRAEDGTRFRHKPPAGNIQVWPIQTP